MDMPIPVFLAKVEAYDKTAFEAAHSLLEAVAMPVSRGTRVLVKPNLLRADSLSCTHPVIIAAACRYLRDRGCTVTIGDSPGFGTARGVAKAIGLNDALAKAGCADIPIITLDSPQSRRLSLGGNVGLSRHALRADHILNLPKLKAHSQMRVTAGVKNLFGCVSGVRKAFLHARYGDRESDGIAVFPSVVADIMTLLPPMTTLLDGITAMHGTGPSGGKPFHAALLAASSSPVALDTAVYSLLGLSVEEIPLWRETQRRNLPGASPHETIVHGEPVESFDLSGFMVPFTLKPQTFNPARLLVSTARRLWARLATTR